MPWRDKFASRVWTMEQAVAAVRSGDTIVGGMPEPTPFMVDLGDRADLEDVIVFIPAPRTGGVAASFNPGIELRSPFRTQLARDTGAPFELLPLQFSSWPGAIRRMAPRIRVVLVAEPQADGTVRPGGTCSIDNELVQHRSGPDDIVIGLVHPTQPQIPGHTFHVDEFDGLVPLPTDAAEPFYDDRKPPAEMAPIAEAIAELIPNGATVQAGVGGIAEDVMARLEGRSDLGIHTEVLGYGLCKLMQSGSVSNRHKVVRPGKTVATISLPEAYDHLHENPSVELLPASQVLDPREIAKNPMPRCVNSALEVDLLGQVNAEMINGDQYSGVGGQLDFLRACQMNEDGLAMTVLPSTARSGLATRIVPMIEGNAITATRYDAQCVVTEHGVAWLRDATARQRAERLISVAAPEYRAELTEAGERLGLIG